MPGRKYASIYYPHMYEGLRKHGFSKARAAAISNSAAKGKRRTATGKVAKRR